MVRKLKTSLQSKVLNTYTAPNVMCASNTLVRPSSLAIDCHCLQKLRLYITILLLLLT